MFEGAPILGVGLQGKENQPQEGPPIRALSVIFAIEATGNHSGGNVQVDATADGQNAHRTSWDG